MVGVIQNKGQPGSMTDHRAECFYGVKDNVDKVAQAPKPPADAAEPAADSSKSKE